MMSEYNSANGDGGGEEAASVLDRAIHAVRSQPLNEDALEQTLARVRSRASALRSGRRHFRGPIGRRWLLAGGAAAAMLTAAAVWLWRPSASWADVAEALRGKLWIHGTGEGDDHHWWFSIERQVFANQHGRWAVFDDNRLNVRYEYDPDERHIVRAIAPDDGTPRSFAELFDGICKGRVRVGLVCGDEEVISQENRRVVDGDRVSDEYDLTLRNIHHLNTNQLKRMRFKVDPNTHLPRSMTVSPIAPPDKSRKESGGFQLIFDYPDSGPVDIYDLGVPRAAEVIDRVPNDDMKRLIAAVDLNRNDFDPYIAVSTTQSVGGPWYSASWFTIVWRKGTRWRAEIGYFNEPPRPPKAGVDRVAWWMEQARAGIYQPVEVCNGETVYRANLSEPNGSGEQTHTWEAVRRLSPSDGIAVAGQGLVRDRLPEMHGYPLALAPASNQFTVNVVEHPTAGPIDSLLVQYAGTAALKLKGVFRDCRYWVDPAKGYVTRQYVLADARNADGTETTDTYSMEELDRSPRGIWYPTLVRRKVVQEPRPADPNYVDETITRFFVDFDAELPDDLFRPIDREAVKR